MPNEFDAIRISLASPEQILSWSYGEVLKPETINYRTLRPERDGLFCERIFGPTKDWECYCGKYKRIRYKGVVCEKCGVEVAPARVRRERMGHISLASPVSHIWYVKGVPSRLGLLLNISPRNLERVLYFAQYIVTKVDEEARSRTIQKLERELALKTSRLETELQGRESEIEARQEEELARLDEELETSQRALEEQLAERTDAVMEFARSWQQKLEASVGKKLRQDLQAEWMEEPLVRKGEEVTATRLAELHEAVQARLSVIEDEVRQEQDRIAQLIGSKKEIVRQQAEEEIEALRQEVNAEVQRLQEEMERDIAELKGISEMQLLGEVQHRELTQKWGNVFSSGMGAEAVREIVARMDLDKMAKELRREIRTTKSKQRRKKAVKQLRVVEAFRKSGNRPEWMILTVLPVIPPELRPMVQLDGGRFATSDLNDLYRRVINRNNRLKRLLELGAPDVIVRNEKRMLQEAVDSLIDNGRRGRAVSRSGKRKLKSLSDMLKGKQGRFRRNLLGKRVDYSGRSVIVVGPELKLHQCGLPKRMALELFKPFVMRKLVEYNHAHNIKSAKRLVDRLSPEVWDVLEEVTQERPVLLNRAPTLHRLGIQAFEVVLVEGSAIQIHPLVCAAFNADFDGDQMAVHVPLSAAAVQEARELMLSTANLLKPASGEPIVGPSKDMVLGCYYLTLENPAAKGAGKAFGSLDEVVLAHDLGVVDLHAPIKVRFRAWNYNSTVDTLAVPAQVQKALLQANIARVGDVVDLLKEGQARLLEIHGLGPKSVEAIQRALEETTLLETTVGRVIFNLALPEELRFANVRMEKGSLNDLIGECYQRLGRERTAELVDEIKRLGFLYATQSGITIAISDISVPELKEKIIEETTAQVEEIERQYRRGLITEEEQYAKVVELWTRATDEITKAVKDELDPHEGIGAMSTSGATKGGIQPVRQLAGMRGLMADPAGRIIALPIRSNFREGLTALEYFLSTHGARKGLADTALRTADAGYLTRRLVDVAQDVIIVEEDCGTHAGIWMDAQEARAVQQTLAERVVGRIAAGPVVDPRTGEVIISTGEEITASKVELAQRAGVDRMYVRSPMTCESAFGLCARCYGQDLARGGMVKIGEAVGIIAAQSIGEPGTQLTLRTFHTGGVAGGEDITQGLPRVEELFEARTPKGEAIIADIDGTVDIYWEGDVRKLKVSDSRVVTRTLEIPANYELVVEDGERVQEDTVIARNGAGEEIVAGMDGRCLWEDHMGQRVAVIRRDEVDEVEYDVPASARLRVVQGQQVRAGEQLTEGVKNPREILRILGREEAQMYLLQEVQKVYRTQGVSINDKHIEIIVRQMTRRVQVQKPNDTEFLTGELVDRFEFEQANQEVLARGGTPAVARPVLLGVTKAALNTESFLAAASFQETTRVLTEAAVKGAKDDLRGLKENVILGRLIPAGTGFRHRERMQEALQAAASAWAAGTMAISPDQVQGDGDEAMMSMESGS
ncbi:MAG: DNA-directed RNA polymerase subunit beta' [Anaerolineae bacterium]